MPKTTFAANAYLNHQYRNIASTPPATIYVALYTTLPTVAGGGVEVSGGSYVRRAVTWGAPSLGVISNSVEVEFPAATAGWGTLLGYGYFDALSAGNLISFSPLGSPRVVVTTDVVRFPVGSLTLTET